jgi:hypothetical protein
MPDPQKQSDLHPASATATCSTAARSPPAAAAHRCIRPQAAAQWSKSRRSTNFACKKAGDHTSAPFYHQTIDPPLLEQCQQLRQGNCSILISGHLQYLLHRLPATADRRALGRPRAWSPIHKTTRFSCASSRTSRGRPQRLSSTIGCGCAPPPSRTESRGLSATAVPRPTRIPS